jgi:hypothetical protein
MKYILTESQYNLILESQKYKQFFQELIDTNLNHIRNECEKENDLYISDVSDYTCDQVDLVERIEVTDAEWMTVKHSNRETEAKYMSVKIMIYFSSIHRGNLDADDLTYDLEQMIRTSTGMPFLLNYESTNTNTSFEW